MQALTEIVTNYVQGTILVVERSLSQPLEEPAELALFKLREACYMVLHAIKDQPEPLSINTLEFAAQSMLASIKACTAI